MANVFKGGRVYLSAEAVRLQARRDYIEKHADVTGEKLVAAIEKIERDAAGEYREVLDEVATDEHGGTEPRLGKRLVFISASPDDPSNDDGHYEVYDAKTHGSPYNPLPNISGAIPQTIDKSGGSEAGGGAGGQA